MEYRSALQGRPPRNHPAWQHMLFGQVPSAGGQSQPLRAATASQGRHSSSESPPLLLRFFLAAGPAAATLALPPPLARLGAAFFFGRLLGCGT